MDSGLIVLQHAVPSTKRSGISQPETASISGSSDSATWMFHSTMWIVFHLGSQFLLDGICRPSWSKLNFHELILGKITSFKHGFRFDSSSTCSAFHKEVWNFTTRNCLSGSSDSATWMFNSTMWMVFHLGSQFLLDGICRPSWSKLNFHELIPGKITSFKHGFRFDSSSTFSAFHKEVWNFTTRNCLHFRVLRQCHVDVSFHHVDGLSSWKSIPPRRNLQAKLVKTELS